MNLKEINDEIVRLENGNTTYSAVEKLACLYTVRNNHRDDGYSFAGEPKSPFLEAFGNAPKDEALKVMDEHMEVIKSMYPKEYEVIVDRLKNLK